MKSKKISLGVSKVEMLVVSGAIEKIKGNTYKVRGHIVNSKRCSCKGFEKHGKCSHFDAVNRIRKCKNRKRR